ncbi:T9SS type B sorting domain-containing protein [Empedobacter stercoris]|uniref:T9SS type B sorting domain-containing protein n=1 Tax=Empedobacter stercoris TaxID=1628248 RepID=UPI0039EA9009
MKKIFYFLLLMISGIVWGQISQFNNLCTNNSNLSLSNTYYEYKFKTPASCSQDQTNSYKSINYYKVVVDGSFEFTLNSTKLVNYHVWVLNDAEINNFFLNKESRYEALRSSYSSLTTEKGLFNSATDECEFYGSADGKLKPLIVSAGQYVVIGVLGLDVNTNFTITPGGTAIVCEPEPVGGNTELSGKCFSEVYTISEVKDKVKSQISVDHSQIVDVNKIKIFNSVTSTDEITTDINSSIGLGQTYIAKVYDNRNVEIYRYTVTINFKAGYNFYFTDYTYEVCGKNYVVNYKDIIEKHVTDYTDVNNFRINYVEYGGVRYSEGQTINFSDDFVRMNVSITYIGAELCESTDDFQIDIRDVKHYNLYTPEIITTCNSKFTINKFDLRIKTQVINDEDYDLKFYLSDGTEVYENNEIDIISGQLNLTYQAVHYRTGCLGEKGTLIIKQTSKANILPAEIKDICLADFTQIHVDNTIDRIQNGNNYNLKYYQEDSLVEITDLFTYIKTTKNGKIIVKALAADNGNTICDTVVELNFSLDESTFIKVDNIPTLISTCAEVGAGYMFAKADIESYLKTVLGTSVSAFQGISNETLADNQSKTISFKVQKTDESCWSEEMILKLQVITRPNVVSATFSGVFCEGETLTIDDDLLKNNFGLNVFDYKIFIDGSEYIQGNSIQRELDFGTNTSLNISVEFKNRLSDTCSMNVDLTVNKKPDLVVDIATLESYIQANPIIYCEGEDENAKNQIKAILKHINSQEPGLVVKSTIDEIFAQIDSNGGFVNVDFEDPNYCGTATIKFYFKRNPLPTITVPEEVNPLCFNELYSLDFTTQTDYDKYTYIVEKVGGTRINGVDKFELDAGIYNITIEDNITGCSVVKTLEVKNAETPTIGKITINETSIIVTAKGNGKLEYALFGSDGNIIVDWQTKNELIIPDKITDNNFTVKVRLNGCGVSERKNVIYLALPNVVTPNQDGKNDVWKPMTKNGKINDVSNSYKLIIFDRYGKQILSKEGTNIIEWDGTHNGKPVADGTYWYMLEFSKQSDDLKVLYSGSILVKRKIK